MRVEFFLKDGEGFITNIFLPQFFFIEISFTNIFFDAVNNIANARIFFLGYLIGMV